MVVGIGGVVGVRSLFGYAFPLLADTTGLGHRRVLDRFFVNCLCFLFFDRLRARGYTPMALGDWHLQ